MQVKFTLRIDPYNYVLTLSMISVAGFIGKEVVGELCPSGGYMHESHG